MCLSPDVIDGAPGQQLLELGGDALAGARSFSKAVPSATALAPARRNSKASVPVMMPPDPMMGSSGSAAWTAHTARSAIGRMAGPLSPPGIVPNPGPGGRVDRDRRDGVDETDPVGSCAGAGQARATTSSMPSLAKTGTPAALLRHLVDHRGRVHRAQRRMRKIDLDPDDAVGLTQPLGDPGVVAEIVGPDGHDHGGTRGAQSRKFVGEERSSPGPAAPGR